MLPHNMIEPGRHYVSEISQAKKGKCCMITLICGIKKKKNVDLIEESRIVLIRGLRVNGEMLLKEYFVM